MKPSGASHWSCSAISSSRLRDRLLAQRVDPRLGGDPHALLDRGQDEDRRRAGEEAGDAGAGSYGRSIANWSSWPNQPWIGVRSDSGSRHVEVADRARAGVEVLVGAADGVARCRASRSTGTAPAEWLRSQMTVPRSNASMSASAPVR